MNIEDSHSISNYAEQLEALGLSGEESLEQFFYMAQVARPELANYLGVDVEVLASDVNENMGLVNQIPMQALEQINKAVYSLWSRCRSNSTFVSRTGFYRAYLSSPRQC